MGLGDSSPGTPSPPTFRPAQRTSTGTHQAAVPRRHTGWAQEGRRRWVPSMCEWPSQPPPHGGRQSGARQAKARALLGEPCFPGWGPAIPAPRRGCLASRPSQRGLCSQHPPPPEGSDSFSLPGAAGGGWPTTPPRSVRPSSRASTSAPQRSGQPLPSGAWGRGGGPLQPGWRPGRPAHTRTRTSLPPWTATRLPAASHVSRPSPAQP